MCKTFTYGVPLLILSLGCVLGTHAETDTADRQAIDRYWEILVRSPRYGTTFDRVSGHYAKTHDYQKLRIRCHAWVAAEPQNAKSHRLLGMVYREQGDWDSAIASFREAVRLDPDEMLSAYYLGMTVGIFNLPDGIEILEKAVNRVDVRKESIQGRHDFREAMIYLSYYYLFHGKPEKTIQTLDRLEKLFQEDQETKIQIAEILEHINPLRKEALVRFERLAKTSEDESVRLQCLLAAACIRVREESSPEVLRDLEKLLENLQPTSPMLEPVRARLERLVNSYPVSPEVLDFYARWMAHLPDERYKQSKISAFFHLTHKAEQQGDFAAAARFQKQLCRYKHDIENWERLFVLYDMGGEVDQAEKLLPNLVLRQKNFDARLAAIDRMIFRKRLDSVERILDFLEIHDGVRNEILLRRWAVALLRAYHVSSATRCVL